MIKKIKGNIFNTSCQTLVNTVNCIGVMGKGIALECKLRFPPMFEKYKNPSSYTIKGDGHPNAKGSELYFKILYEELKKIIE